jgi:exosortase A-associated hydrolase 2
MTPGKCGVKAEFLEHLGRKLFCLILEPADNADRGSILFLPPFAEEMHKSRRLVACQARELAEAGYRVMLLDITGCGDSGGDFSDASWKIWLQDAQFAAHFLIDQGTGPLYLWGLRMGALLACELAHERAEFQKLVLWQPVLNGEQQVDQFLRLRTVPFSANTEATFDRKSLWKELRAGRSLEIAGYELSSKLALELARARLNDLRPQGQVRWLEIGMVPDARLAAGSENVVAHWREQGISVDTGIVKGDPFWRSVDADINLALQQRTLDAFSLP